jgi:hypothetical protein
MDYRIRGLDPAPFAPLFDLDDAALRERGAVRRVAEAPRAAPCRVSLADADPGEELLLVNFEHQPAASPYRSCHAIYVRRGPVERFDATNAAPPVFAGRKLALRGFDVADMIDAAELVAGDEAEAAIRRLLDRPSVVYIHAHFAAHGCFACRIDRA